MPENPITTPLPADLPENWVNTQTIAAEGADVGLSEKHGYNYLMKQVNAAQEGVNTLGNALEDLTPGELGVTAKKTYTYVIGTSTNGWTEKDCDYLCDGVEDQVEINAAIKATLNSEFATIKFLPGTYNLSDQIDMEYSNYLTLTGTSNASVVLNFQSQNLTKTIESVIYLNTARNIVIDGFTFSQSITGTTYYPYEIISGYYSPLPPVIKNCVFEWADKRTTGILTSRAIIENCTFKGYYNSVVEFVNPSVLYPVAIRNSTFALSSSVNTADVVKGFNCGTIVGCSFTGAAGGAVIESTSKAENCLVLHNTFNSTAPITIGFNTGNLGGSNLQVIGNIFGEDNQTFINFMSTAFNLSNVICANNVIRAAGTADVLQFAQVSRSIISNNVIHKRDSGTYPNSRINLQTVNQCSITNNIMDTSPVQVHVTNSFIDNNIIIFPEETA